MKSWLAPIIPTLLIVACATQASAPVASSTEPAVTVVKPAPAPKPPASSTARVAPKAKKPGPIPTRPLNVAADCSFRDETGYNGRLKLAVKQAQVEAFEAAITIPRRGVCRFDLRHFRQTRDLPNVVLNHLHDGCIVRLWEQEEQVTVAFQQCGKMCSGDAWEYLWPILNDTRNGSCA